jgi:hypothetical protein
MPANPPAPVPIFLTANLSGTWPDPTVDLVASGANAGLWDQPNQVLILTGLSKTPPPAVPVTIVIGSSTIIGNPPVIFPASGAINFHVKGNPNGPPPPGLFGSIVVSADGQTLSFTDQNGGGGAFKFLLRFVLGPPANGTFIHDPEIENTGSSEGN